eukprot:9058387-Prorocentrum_lima.AAC.1
MSDGEAIRPPPGDMVFAGTTQSGAPPLPPPAAPPSWADSDVEEDEAPLVPTPPPGRSRPQHSGPSGTSS